MSIFDQEHFSNNMEIVKELINRNNESHNQAHKTILKLLEVPYTDDKYIFDLLNLQKQCKIDEYSFAIYDQNRCNAIAENMKNNKDNKPAKAITVTMTTCKRLDLFTQTVNSFLFCCEDLKDYITDWIVVDDNSSEEDRKFMQEKYPFITYILKTPDKKGHAISMNILLENITTPYIFHLEDDWRFFVQDRYISKCLTVLSANSKYGQCLINRVYGEDIISGASIGGGHRRYIEYEGKKLRYYINEYIAGDSLEKMHIKLSASGFNNCLYWPHYSLRVGVTRKEVFDKLGTYNKLAEHFEKDYAYRYIAQGFLTTYLDNVYCSHIGRKTYERGGQKVNAYDLNEEKQFGADPKDTSDASRINESDKDVKKVTNQDISKDTSNDINKDISKDKLLLKTYVLNLERRPDRLEKFKLSNKNKLDKFHVFKAVDGLKLDPCCTIQKLFEHNDYNYRRGIVGCAISHLFMWIELASSPILNGMLIIEDDAVLVSNFMAKFVYLLSNTPEADIIFLGHHPYPTFVRPDDYVKNGLPKAEQWSKEKSIKQSMGGTTAYYISKKGAVNMFKWIESHSFRYGVDWEMFHNDLNKVYYCSPFIAFADCAQSVKNVDTDIQHVYDGVGYKENEWLEKEIKRWGYKGVSKKFKDLDCEEDDNSNIVCREEKCEKKELLTSISIFRKANNIIDWLNQYPVHWYTVNKWIFCIPDNRISDDEFDNSIFSGYTNLNVLKNLMNMLKCYV